MRPSLASALRGLTLAIGAAAVAWPLARGGGIAAAAAGAFAGVAAADVAAGTALRTAAGVGLAAMAAIVGLAAASLCTAAPVAGVLGALPALAASDVAFWFSLAAAVAFALRLGAARRPALAVVEIAALALALAINLGAHRRGMVHRPLALGDWAWGHGFDPATVLLWIGAAGGIFLAAQLFTGGRERPRLWHLLPLLLLLAVVPLLVPVVGTPIAPSGGGLGLAGEAPAGERRARGKKAEGEESAGRDDRRAPDDIDFRDEYSTGGPPIPVAVVIFGSAYTPRSDIYYFRQTAFSQFNGRRLVQATVPGVDGDLIDHFPAAPMRLAAVPPDSAPRRELETTIGLVGDHVRPFALDAPLSVWPVESPDPSRFRLAYGVRSRVLTAPYEDLLQAPAPAAATLDERARRYYTAAPQDPRYRELAEEAVAILRPDYRTNALAEAFAVKFWLEKAGTYSRLSHHASAVDPTASFLFGDRIGYCVHFAHAAAFLLRSLDVPARVAAGYAVPARRRGSGSALAIVGGDAHVWPEVWVDGAGWVVVDIAPEKSLEPPAEEPDQALQRMLGEAMRTTPAESSPELAAEDTWTEALSAARLRRLALLAALALLLGGYALKIYRALVPYVVAGERLHRLGYRAAADRLSAIGYRRAAGESRERFAARAAAVAPSFSPLTWAHLGPPLGSARRAEGTAIRGLVAAVGAEIRQRAPAWKRLAGVLNPFSWLGTR